MPAVLSKVVTIIVAEESHTHVIAGLKATHISGYTYCTVNGKGTRGERHGGVFGAQNVMTTVVTSAENATKLMHWFETELVAHATAIIYVVDAQAIIVS